MRRNGFTLIEMLVALIVFAMIAGGALMLLRFSVDAELASNVRTEQMAAQRRFLSVWNADLAQASPRPVRDGDGAVEPALLSGEGRDFLSVTRSGWENPMQEARPSLQHVRWAYDGATLARVGYPFPDGAQPPEPSAMIRVAAPPKLRFRMAEGNWVDRWEPRRLADLPTAIELSLPQQDGSILRIVSPVGANYQ